ncbi:MAG: hypothetical protein HYS12_13315 [Planctomycetes bacterium]|nr:hypothetical protein [Planctomycetota bacterium]
MSKDAIIGPGTFALIGAATGVSLGMLVFHDRDEWGRVSLVVSCPLAIGGALLGSFFGVLVSSIYHQRPGLRTALSILTVMLLGGSSGAPIGWLLGGSLGEMPYPTHEDFEEATRQAMGSGALIGAISGLFLALLQTLWERRVSVRHRQSSSQCSPSSGMGLSTRYAIGYLLMSMICPIFGFPLFCAIWLLERSGTRIEELSEPARIVLFVFALLANAYLWGSLTAFIHRRLKKTTGTNVAGETTPAGLPGR